MKKNVLLAATCFVLVVSSCIFKEHDIKKNVQFTVDKIIVDTSGGFALLFELVAVNLKEDSLILFNGATTTNEKNNDNGFYVFNKKLSKRFPLSTIYSSNYLVFNQNKNKELLYLNFKAYSELIPELSSISTYYHLTNESKIITITHFVNDLSMVYIDKNRSNEKYSHFNSDTTSITINSNVRLIFYKNEILPIDFQKVVNEN